MSKNQPFSDQLRQAILRSKKTRYRISAETGIAQSILSRFVREEGGMRLDNIDLVMEAIGGRLQVDAEEPKRKRSKKGRKGK